MLVLHKTGCVPEFSFNNGDTYIVHARDEFLNRELTSRFESKQLPNWNWYSRVNSFLNYV